MPVTPSINALIQVGDFKTYYYAPNSPMLSKTDLDDLFQGIINGVSDEIEDYLSHPVVVRTFTATFDSNGKPFLFLPENPIVAVTSITIDGQVVDPATVTVYAKGLYYSSGWGRPQPVIPGEYHDGLSLLPSFTPKGISITYTAGYSVIPDRILMCAKQLAALDANESPAVNNWLGKRSVTASSQIGHDTTSLDPTARTAIKARISTYKRKYL